MSGPLEELYQAIILDHYRKPRNRGTLPDPTVRMDGNNPLCGDQIHLELQIGPDGKITDIKSSGHGCSISQASTSIMTELLKGRSLEDAQRLFDIMRSMMQGGVVDEEEVGELIALKGVSKFPVRIKCAMLCWMTFAQALAEYKAGRNGSGTVVSTEDDK
ncbi:MAG: SUF system NifU family Fe-S cluster assembly protein [Verrucomicrobiae bacterium]|nr:SUF system NifU family Fe-S cluster assembly protein [Verrucomicrobiae bacterium]